MRGRKDEEKLPSPMFPRLHINDTEKGGPRAPPRNKMALYEQLSIPTPKFSSGSAPTTPLSSSSSVSSTSSSHMVSHKRSTSIFSPSSKFLTQSHQVEKRLSYASREAMQNNMTANSEQMLVKPSLVSGSFSSSPQYNSFGRNEVSNLKNISSKNIREKQDFCVSASDQRITEQPKNDVHNHERERMSSIISSSAQLRIACEPQTNIAVVDLESRKSLGSEAEEIPKLTKAIQDPVERPTVISSVRDEVSTDAYTSASIEVNDSGKAMQPLSSLARENWSSISNSNRLFDANVRTYQECLFKRKTADIKDKVGRAQVPVLEMSSTVIRESCSALSPRNDRDFDTSDNCSRRNEDEKCATVNLRDVDGEDNVSDVSMVDPVSAPTISPDVVVGVIGKKQFWKARKAIVHQQRTFAVQVFELHRLIKVQRLIAESPLILLDDYLDKPPSTLSDVKNKSTERVQPPVPSATLKDNHQHPDLNSECADKNTHGKLPLPPFNKNTKELQEINCELYPKNTPETPVAASTKSEPWCLNPIAGNQWLVPVMLPSEGLIYKPYTGPFPPNAGYMAPMYGNCGSVNSNTGSGDIFTTAYAVPASHHQGVGFFPGTIPMNRAYFPPYGVPVNNQSMFGSVTDQLSTGDDVDHSAHQQNSCVFRSQMSHVMPLHGSMGSELQEDASSSPPERGNGDVLPLFPTEPTIEQSCRNAESSEHKSRAIKVVPHNPSSASESAARIFQLIQEERKQL